MCLSDNRLELKLFAMVIIFSGRRLTTNSPNEFFPAVRYEAENQTSVTQWRQRYLERAMQSEEAVCVIGESHLHSTQ